MAETAEIANSGVPDKEVAIVVGWYKALAVRARTEILTPGGGTEKTQASKMSTAKLKASLQDHETNSSNPDHPVSQSKVSVLMGELEARGVKINDLRPPRRR